jgi:hypothetical protein
MSLSKPLGCMAVHSTEVKRGLVCEYHDDKLAGAGGLMKELAQIMSDVLCL